MFTTFSKIFSFVKDILVLGWCKHHYYNMDSLDMNTHKVCRKVQHFTVSLTLSSLGKNSADDILKWFSYFFQKTGFDIWFKHILFHKVYTSISIMLWEYIIKDQNEVFLLLLKQLWKEGEHHIQVTLWFNNCTYAFKQTIQTRWFCNQFQVLRVLKSVEKGLEKQQRIEKQHGYTLILYISTIAAVY